MNFSVDLSQFVDVPADVLLLCVGRSPIATPDEKKLAAKLNQNLVVPPGLSPIAARTLLRSQRAANQSVTKSSIHANGVMNAVRETSHVVELLPTEAKIETIPQPVSYNYGYYCNDMPKVVKSHIADRVAYAYSPNVDTTHAVRESIFMKAAGAAALPNITAILPGSEDPAENESWVQDRASKNAIKILNTMVDTESTKDVIRTTGVFMDNIVKEYPDQTLKNKMGVIQRFIPKMKVCKNEEQAYNLLSVHKSIRGEDGDASNAMTIGYYMGHMPAAMYRTFWSVSDVLYAARLLQVDAIVLDVGLSATIAMSLIANNFTVVQLVSDPAKRFIVTDEQGMMSRGVVHQLVSTLASTIKCNALYVMNSINKSSVQFTTKKGVVVSDSLKNVIEGVMAVREEFHVMAWVPVCNQGFTLAAQYKLSTHYSTHAHAGQVVVIRSKADLQSVELVTTLDRMTNANIIKTWFPISRTRFFDIDLAKYRYNHPCIMGVKLQFTVKSRKAARGVEMEDARAEADLLQAVGDQAKRAEDMEIKDFVTAHQPPVAPVHQPQSVKPPAGVQIRPRTEVPDEEFDFDLADDLQDADDDIFATMTGNMSKALPPPPIVDKTEKEEEERRRDQELRQSHQQQQQVQQQQPQQSSLQGLQQHQQQQQQQQHYNRPPPTSGGGGGDGGRRGKQSRRGGGGRGRGGRK